MSKKRNTDLISEESGNLNFISLQIYSASLHLLPEEDHEVGKVAGEKNDKIRNCDEYVSKVEKEPNYRPIDRDYFFTNFFQSNYATYTDYYKKNYTVEKDDLDFILSKLEKSHNLVSKEDYAYILATIKEETRHSFISVQEGPLNVNINKRISILRDYYKTYTSYETYKDVFPSEDDSDNAYFGRGFGQLTLLSNYKKFETYSEFIDVPLVNNPDFAYLCREISWDILEIGMTKYPFMGDNSLSYYMNQNPPDYYGARDIINKFDIKLKRTEIQHYAEHFAEWIIEVPFTFDEISKWIWPKYTLKFTILGNSIVKLAIYVKDGNNENIITIISPDKDYNPGQYTIHPDIFIQPGIYSVELNSETENYRLHKMIEIK